MKPTAVVGRRVAAFLIDTLDIFIVNALIFFPLAKTDEEIARQVASGEIAPDASTYVNVTLGDNTYSLVGGEAALYFLVTFLIGFGYWVVLQGKTGWTVGKLAVGIRLVGEDGRTGVGILRSFVRQLLWIVDAFPYFIPYLTGFVLALATPRNRRVGDMAARTLVVDRRFAEQGGPETTGLETRDGGPFGEPSPPLSQPSPPLSQPSPPFSQPSPPVSPPREPEPAAVPAGWHPDPKGEKRLRYWDGSAWTDHTAD